MFMLLSLSLSKALKTGGIKVHVPVTEVSNILIILLIYYTSWVSFNLRTIDAAIPDQIIIYIYYIFFRSELYYTYWFKLTSCRLHITETQS